eukprot:NODE_15162_length_224_cov_7.080000_g14249_i0.p3 GENE.NODE_15162_length_224_cov_7.080000_g14249_i0~~NODE_15162_length_224_cov_7.080000_g14249_i0.p3  ORF type:complete len:53 (-),score=21.28 NODE_15162_length_224_cov_7.080000_g14249_i0:66-194(-)
MFSGIKPIIDERNGRDSRLVFTEYIKTLPSPVNIAKDGRITS